MRYFALFLLGLAVVGCNGGSPAPTVPHADLFNPDGTLKGDKTNTEDGQVEGDQDADGLTDADEAIWGTDPTNPDTDGDALLDGWEVHGVDGTKLKDDFDTHPRHIDVLVEMDFMVRDSADKGLGPSEDVKKAIIEALSEAPVTNHDGTKGIHLVLDHDASAAGTKSDNRGGEITHAAEVDSTSFYTLKANNFEVMKRGRTFHYMIWADAWKGDMTSGHAMGIPYPDFVVHLGAWNKPEDSTEGQGGTDEQKIGTFIHELGHSLGLRHGGSDDDNYKPNHISVMNYFWQTTGLKSLAGAKKWTYQWLELPELDETSLDEGAGLGLKIELKDYATAWHDTKGTPRFSSAAEPIDWEFDSVEKSSVAVNLNLSTASGVFAHGGSDVVPVPPEGQGVLAKTPNEWLILVYKSGILGSGIPADELADMGFTPPSPQTIPKETLTNKRADALRKALFN